MYQRLKPLIFSLEPEPAHDLALTSLAAVSASPGALRLLRSVAVVNDPRLRTRAFGLEFPNPIGLAAGFDKNARAIPALQALGFGHLEVGSVTALAQPGNERPRLFRLPADEAVINRMGFNNAGAEAVAARLARLFAAGDAPRVPLGINLGKSKVTSLADAPGDYLRSLELLWPYGGYFVINVSSPNTPGLRTLQDRAPLEELLHTVTSFVRARGNKPVLLKIAPDLTFLQIDEIIELAKAYGLAGLIATNTTVTRPFLYTPTDEAGGLSGPPLAARSLEVLRYVRAAAPDLEIISVGGIATPEDAVARLRAGASLVQVYTALVYEGPFLARHLNRGVLRELRHQGLSHLSALHSESA